MMVRGWLFWIMISEIFGRAINRSYSWFSCRQNVRYNATRRRIALQQNTTGKSANDEKSILGETGGNHNDQAAKGSPY